MQMVGATQTCFVLRCVGAGASAELLSSGALRAGRIAVVAVVLNPANESWEPWRALKMAEFVFKMRSALSY